MNAWDIGLIVYSGIAIAGGQGCMTAFARQMPLPFEFVRLARYCVTASSFYGFIALYGSGMAVMIYLLGLGRKGEK